MPRAGAPGAGKSTPTLSFVVVLTLASGGRCCALLGSRESTLPWLLLASVSSEVEPSSLLPLKADELVEAPELLKLLKRAAGGGTPASAAAASGKLSAPSCGARREWAVWALPALHTAGLVRAGARRGAPQPSHCSHLDAGALAALAAVDEAQPMHLATRRRSCGRVVSRPELGFSCEAFA